MGPLKTRVYNLKNSYYEAYILAASSSNDNEVSPLVDENKA
jgi:hypothetical protein